MIQYAKIITLLSNNIFRLGAILLAVAFFEIQTPIAGAQQNTYVTDGYTPGQGPYIADPDILRQLDCPDRECNGPLNFAKLIQKQFKSAKFLNSRGTNPFTLPEARLILSTIKSDLEDVGIEGNAVNFQLSPRFLEDPSSRIELVGIVNRMDRQFHRDQKESICGEISVIYRFSYSIREGKQNSRLPITMNIVFPASAGGYSCKSVAKSWLDAVEYIKKRNSSVSFHRLTDPSGGPIAPLLKAKISRLELNMQAYRKPASVDPNDFGTEATYLIRVFRWDGTQDQFLPVALPNQLDRNAVLCKSSDSFAICELKRRNRIRLVTFLQQPDTVASVDNGTLSLPSSLDILSRRAVSFSPGGSHRTTNQPYWNALRPSEQVVTDQELLTAMDRARSAGIILTHIGSVEDFRARLNDSTCTGCHQTRAIAGFHFPGIDRVMTPPANSVLLAGSPHFYGDQPRRLDIVRAIAKSSNGTLSDDKLTMSYSARPLARYTKALKATELIGGWGAVCITPDFLRDNATSRQWGCKAELRCERLFSSTNDPGIGTCVPDGRIEVGDALQRGGIETLGFGRDKDRYIRTHPGQVQNGDTRIPASALPSGPPHGNSYYGAHQEFYFGTKPTDHPACKTDPSNPNDKPKPDCYDIRRDYFTGGFPSGMLRLSECIGLPDEATCGLIASSGFNSCISKIGTEDKYNVNLCFDYFTSFGGIRACDIANPCRDDYICIKPMNYTSTTYEERLMRLSSDPFFENVNGRKYDPNDHGQKKPDDDWVARNDQRGLCIPPYFVFQFRADGHPAP